MPINKVFFYNANRSPVNASNPPSSKLPDSISIKADVANFCKILGELEKASSHAFSARISSRIKEAI